MSIFPPVANLDRRLRLLTAANPEVGAPILIGSPLLLTAGIVDVAVAPGTLVGFAEEPRDPDNQPQFSTGGGEGGAFTVAVHGLNAVLVAVGYPGATFIMDYTDGAGVKITPPATVIGQVYDLDVDAVTGAAGVDSTTAGAGTTVKVVNIISSDVDQSTPILDPATARFRVEVVLITPQLGG